MPPLAAFARLLEGLAADASSRRRWCSCRLLAQLLKDPELGTRIVPIVADEARTFGMQTLFRQVGIYSAVGQLYEPEDHDELLYYKEAKDGQILEEGITEAGAMSSWIAAATSYSAHGTPMLPFYAFYSMFGFQRIGDLIWAAADSRSRGFLIGATAGRTTLAGEGLQHQDGSSHLDRLDHSELRRLRSVLRLRARGDPAGRHAPDAGGAGGRVLLRHGDERELRAAAAAGGRGGGHPARHVPAARVGAARRAQPRVAACRRGHHPARSARRRGACSSRSTASPPMSGA